MHPQLFPFWQKLEAEKAAFEKQILQESSEGLQFKKSPEVWNMLEVFEHVVITENMSTDFLIEKGLMKSKKEGGRSNIFKAVFLSLMLKSPLKFKVPEVKGIKPKGETEMEELFLAWNSSREKLFLFLEQFPGSRLDYLIFRHPSVGWLNLKGTLRFLASHIYHHQHQLSRIRKSRSFPFQEKTKTR